MYPLNRCIKSWIHNLFVALPGNTRQYFVPTLLEFNLCYKINYGITHSFWHSHRLLYIYKFTIFWNMLPCKLVDRHKRFRRIWCLILQRKRVIRCHEKLSFHELFAKFYVAETTIEYKKIGIAVTCAISEFQLTLNKVTSSTLRAESSSIPYTKRFDDSRNIFLALYE